MRRKQPPPAPIHREVSELFVFCRLRYQDLTGDIKSKDSAIANKLLGFNYKYAHQFKYGAIKIRHVLYLRRLGAALKVPERYLVKILRHEWTAEQTLATLKLLERRKYKKITFKTDNYTVDFGYRAPANILKKDIVKAIKAAWKETQIAMRDEHTREAAFAEASAYSENDLALVKDEVRPLLTHVRRKTESQQQTEAS